MIPRRSSPPPHRPRIPVDAERRAQSFSQPRSSPPVRHKIGKREPRRRSNVTGHVSRTHRRYIDDADTLSDDSSASLNHKEADHLIAQGDVDILVAKAVSEATKELAARVRFLEEVLANKEATASLERKARSLQETRGQSPNGTTTSIEGNELSTSNVDRGGRPRNLTIGNMAAPPSSPVGSKRVSLWARIRGRPRRPEAEKIGDSQITANSSAATAFSPRGHSESRSRPTAGSPWKRKPLFKPATAFPGSPEPPLWSASAVICPRYIPGT